MKNSEMHRNCARFGLNSVNRGRDYLTTCTGTCKSAEQQGQELLPGEQIDRKALSRGSGYWI